MAPEQLSTPRFCQQCGHYLIERYIDAEGRRRFQCENCGFVHYMNPRVVAAMIVEHTGRVLLQQRAIENVARVLKRGGRFILVEGLADGRRNLNALRAQMGLSEMPAVWHNVDFEEAQLMPYLDRFFTVDARRHFGVYDFVSRIVHPMAVAPASPVYDSPVNRTAAQLAVQLQEFAALSRVVFLVLSRRP